ncbi:MAG: HAD-IA family hydrolase [Roseburia sp.]|nr:HAD-IA family hydrolase [Roseburia sp.]
MKKYDTVIFDLDGTLLNTLEDLHDCVNVVMRQFGWEEHSLEQIRRFVGNGIGKLMERSVPDGRENERFEEAFSEFKSYYTSHCQIKTRPYDGVIELLAYLKEKGYRIAIVSNKNDAAVKELNQIYFAHYTGAAIGDREGARRKPAPDSVFTALSELGSCKERAVYIGDSEVDYETAANSGIDCILVSWGFRDRELLESFEGALVVDHCEEICRYLG